MGTDQRTRERRGGFTIIELLVTIAIIAVLTGLAIPAVSAARGVARQMQCRGRLMQIGLAVQQYHDFAGVLPPGTVSEITPVVPDASQLQHSWLTRLTPMLDLPTLHRATDFGVSIYAPANDRLHSLHPVPLRCPSADDQLSTSYVGIHHDVPKSIGDDDAGLLFADSRLSWSDVPDGRSATMLAAETVVPAAVSWASGTRATLRYASLGSPARPPTLRTMTVEELRAGAEPPVNQETEEALAAPISSNHGPFATAVMADGRVVVLNYEMDAGVLRSIANRDDGQPLEGFE